METTVSGEKLTAAQKAILNYELAGYHFANHTSRMELHLKTYDKEGKRVKWSVHAKATTDFGFFTANTITTKVGHEWEFNAAVKDALRKIEEQVEEAKSRTSH